MTFALETKNLSFRYPGKDYNVLDGIDLQISPEETVAIVGLSGCGKSTLCYCLCGIIPHVYPGKMGGEVFLYGSLVKNMNLPKIAAMLGIVFQNPESQLFSPTVEDELAFGPENLCIEREEIGRRIEESLRKVGMEEYRYMNPNNLSGGQKQLIALASVLSLEPEILIFDEAMAQIDLEGKKLIKETIKKLKAAGKTIVLVEHDFNNLDIADRVLLLKNGKLQAFDGNL